MTTKLTLTIDESIIDSAKAYARDQGRSLSDVVENYLKVNEQIFVKEGMGKYINQFGYVMGIS